MTKRRKRRTPHPWLCESCARKLRRRNQRREREGRAESQAYQAEHYPDHLATHGLESPLVYFLWRVGIETLAQLKENRDLALKAPFIGPKRRVELEAFLEAHK